MSAARYLAFYDQTDPLTFPSGTPTAYPIRQMGDGVFDPVPVPQFAEVTSQEALNRVWLMESTRYVLKGKVSTYLFPQRADWWLGWACDLTSNELGAKAAQGFDGVEYRQTLGCYIEQLTLTAAATQDEGIVKLDADILAIKPGASINGTSFPPPSTSSYPTTNPYKLYESKGGLILIDTGSTARTKYDSFTLTIKNNLSVNWDEDQYASDITFHGRTITLDANIRYTAVTDRTNFEAKKAMKGSILFTKVLTGGAPNTHTCLIDLLANNVTTALDKSLPLAKPGYQKMTLRSVLNASGNDISRTIAFV